MAIKNSVSDDFYLRSSIVLMFSISMLSPDWRRMAIENSVSNDFYLRSSILFMFSIAAYSV